jgi:prepilin-type N-terminal cleavage/methylation domain-containing protein
MRQRGSLGAAGFSLIEVIVVVAIIAFVYTVAMPQFNARTGTEMTQKLNQLSSDVRSAYDLSVLTGKTYRFVFQFNSGDYWLEEPDRPDVYLGAEKLDRDPTEAEEKDEQQAFDTKFQEYVDLAGQAVADPKGDHEIPPTSPVVTAKAKLRKPTWTRVENLEWSARTLGPHLMIRDMQAEHHGHKQDLVELGPDARAMIYIFPSGYIERAVIHIAVKKDEMTPDETQEPYTITTDPYEGIAEIESGYQDVDVHEDKDS